MEPCYTLDYQLVREASPHDAKVWSRFIVLSSLLVGFFCAVHWGQVPLTPALTISMAIQHLQPVGASQSALPLLPARTWPMRLRGAKAAASLPLPKNGNRRGSSSTVVHGTVIPDKYNQIETFGELVILKTGVSEETKIGGIVVPMSVFETMNSGTVSVVGNGIMPAGGTRPFAVQPGDNVIYAQQFGNDIKWNMEDYKIVRESDILGTTPKRAMLDADIKKLRPINDFLLVRMVQPEMSAKGLFLDAPDDSILGEVVRAGGGRWDPVTKETKPMTFKAGDKVLFSKLAGQDAKLTKAGKKFLVLREPDILAKVDG